MALEYPVRSDGSAPNFRLGLSLTAGAVASAFGLFLMGPAAVAAADGGTADRAADTAAVSPRDHSARTARSAKAAPPRTARVADAGPARTASSAAPASSAQVPRASAATQPVANDAPVAGVPVAAARAGGLPSRANVSRTNAGRAVPAPAAVAAADAQPTSPASTGARTRVTESVPRAHTVAAPVASVAPAGNPVLSAVNTTAVSALGAVAEWLAVLPDPGISDLLAGALLRLRRDWFDQAPVASPVQLGVTPSGRFVGTVGAVDLEGDALVYSVTTKPEFGTVELDAAGQYVYTPGEQFAGTDRFTVRVAEADGGINLLALGADRAAEVTILVGADAPTNPFATGNYSTTVNYNDASLFLSDTAATITVTRNGFALLGSIALNVPDDTALVWLDRQGRSGQISAADVASHWDGIESAGDVMLGINYVLDDGTEATMILQSVQATTTAAGQYLYSGVLVADVPDATGVTSFWDVIGTEYKASYQNFLAKNGMTDWRFQSFTQDITRADCYLSTYGVADYKSALAGTDPGVAIGDLADALGGAAATNQVVTANRLAAAKAADPRVTTMLQLGDSVVLGQQDGSVEQWTGESFVQLQGTGWGSAVRTMVAYRDGLVVGLENGSVQQWTGTAWQELRGYTQGQPQLVTMLAYKEGVVVGQSDGSVQQWTGTEWKELLGANPRYYGAVVAMDTWNWSQEFVIGTAGGVVTRWTGTEWQDIVSRADVVAEQLGAVTALVTTDGSVVIGRQDGVVDQWTGTVQWDGSMLRRVAGPGAMVTAMTQFGVGQVVVGRADGSVQKLTSDEFGRLSEQKLLGAGGTYFGPSGSVPDAGGTYFGGNFLGDTITAETTLKRGDSMTSANGAYTLALQQDGNLVLARTDDGVALWATNEYGDRAVLQSDGNFVQYWGDTPLWQSDTMGQQNVRVVVQDDGNLVLYSGDTWEWASKTYTTAAPQLPAPVTTILAYGSGFAIGYANGAIKQFGYGSTPSGPSLVFSDLARKRPGGVTALAPYTKGGDTPDALTGLDGFYVGLSNGVVDRCNTWSSDKWTEMRTVTASAFSQQTLADAVAFAQGGGLALSASDPLFTTTAFQPKCQAEGSCDGSVYPLNLSKPLSSLVGTSFAFAGEGQSIDLSFDLGQTSYGYVYVPGGVWKKLNPDEYSFGAMLALTTGPSVTLNLGGAGGELHIAGAELTGPSWTAAGPYGVVELTGDVSASLDVILGLPEGFEKDTLEGRAYVTGGIVLAYNTPSAYWNSAWNYYTDVDFSDFTNLESVSIIPSLTPTVTGTWGLFTPTTTPLIGKVSVAETSLAYSNPVDLNLTFAKGLSPSLTLGSSGSLEFVAGFVPGLTDSLTYQQTFPVYDVRTGNLLV